MIHSRKSIKIRDLGRVVTGSTPSTKRQEYYGSEYLFVKPSDITLGGRHVIRTETLLSELGYENQQNRLLPKHATCIVCIGTIGKMCLTSQPCFTNQQINSVIVDEQRFDPLYVYYLLSTYIPTVKKLEGGSASGREHVNKSTFENIAIEVHDLSAQRKIAAILSEYDDLIENNTRRIKILEQVAQAIYREWFVKFRFPGHENVRMVDSPLGPIPEGWEVKLLSELVTTQYGYTESANDDPIGPRYVRGMDINKTSYIDWSSVPYCPISDSDFSKFRLSKGDVMVIRMADPGKVGIVEKDTDAVFASYLVRLSPKSQSIMPYFLFYFLKSDRYQGYITGASTGTTRKSASAGVMIGIETVLPPFELIESFECVTGEFRSLLNSLIDKNDILRKTRDLLLPRLISGELDVADLDISVGEYAS